MNQPMSEILVTGHSVESYQAVSGGAVFQRNAGNRMLEDEELVDSHFSVREQPSLTTAYSLLDSLSCRRSVDDRAD